MCLKALMPKMPETEPLAPPPAVKPLPDIPTQPQKPKPLRDKGDIAKVQYGTTGKKAVQGQATGTASLRIPLNTGIGSDTTSGGLNT